MPQNGLFIHYERCTGCHACEAACTQEHNATPGNSGIIVNEMITQMNDKVYVDYLPVPTRFCDLCAERTGRGEAPACVKHCQAFCMSYGTVTKLAEELQDKPRSVIFAPK
jgi:Fe-S-cluster-containing dehydrogenase component